MRALLLPILVLFLLTGANAQTRSISIQGTVSDTLFKPLDLATVILMDPVDSTLVDWTRSDEKGIFKLSGIRRGDYLLKVTYVGYMPVLVRVEPGDANQVDLGVIPLVEIASDLFEVVVREFKAPMSIRGDTIEYDASKFQVPPGSTVEDLLRRLPGVEVSREGTITSEGQEIRQVTVDGRRFFGGDPKAATKNLPAEGVQKVQIYEQETEEKKLTGVSSGPPEKMMNLELKEDFKKGGFGKIIAGAGNDERAELKGNYNKFDKKQQLSILGVGNNTGRNGLGWNDYQDFMGSQAMNWDDGGDFGFGGAFGGMMRMMTFYQDEDDISLQGSFFGNQSAGLPRNANTGINYSWFSDKTEVNSTYFFQHSNLLSEATRNQQNFLPGQTFFNRDENVRDATRNSHLMQVRVEHKIDSLHTLVLNGNGSFAGRDNADLGQYRYLRSDESLSNFTEFNNRLQQQNLALNGSVVFRKKYSKKGRASGISANYLFNDSDTEASQFSDNNFYDLAGMLDSLAQIVQDNFTLTRRHQIKSSLLHVEPLGKNFFAQTFYNFSRRIEQSDRDVFDIENGQEVQNDFLSRYYTNEIDLHRLGLQLRYTHKNINLSIGAARQLFALRGDFRSGPGAGIEAEIDRDFYNWIPNLNLTYTLKRGQFLGTNYTANVREPSIRNLQPIVDNSNPLFIREGNPNLIPQIDHQVSGWWRKSNMFKLTNLSVMLNFTVSENQFVQEQTVDEQFVTTSRLTNYKGGQRLFSNFGYGFPIIKNKLTTQLTYNGGFNRAYALVNTVENETFTINQSGNIRLTYTPNPSFNLFTSARVGYADTRYSLHTSQNQVLFTESYSLDVNARTFWGIFVNSTFTYDRFLNDRFDFEEIRPIWNASVYKVLPPSDRWEIRLSIYDILNRNLGIDQIANANLVSETRTLTLTRYTLLSLTYNLQGIDTRLSRRQNFMF